MMPVPFFQVVEFLDWIENNSNINPRNMSTDSLRELALVYLRRGPESGGINFLSRLLVDSNGDARRLIISVLHIFQACPMIGDSSLDEQMRHFSTCGQCINYINERGSVNLNNLALHPLLKRFTQSPNFKQLVDEFQEKSSSLWGEIRQLQDAEQTERIFRIVINALGDSLHRAFREFISNEQNHHLVRSYEHERAEIVRRGLHPNQFSSRGLNENSLREDGTLPLGIHNERVEDAAMRLADSVRFLIESDFYEEQVRHNPQVFELLRATGIVSSNAAQAIEFIWWLQDRHPNLDLLASMPTNYVQDLVTVFCEEKNYQNAASFSKEVMKWLQGEGENRILRRLIELGNRIKRRNKTYRHTVSPFKRYQTVPYHAIYLFLSVGDFPEYVNKYWEDLNYLTGDHLDIYYSFEDLERKISAYETLSEFRSLYVEATALPAMLLWKNSLSESCVISLRQLSHNDIFDVTKLITQKIAAGEKLETICQEANNLVHDKTETLLPGPKIIIRQGEVTMGDKYTVGQAGAVGPHSHAHDMTFNQIWNQTGNELDLEKLANELSILRTRLKEEASEPEHDSAIGEVASAEVAAKKGDGPVVLAHLSKAGRWALDVAVKIGVSVAATALKTALGL